MLRDKYNLDAYDILCLKKDIDTKKAQIQTNKDQNISQQKSIEKELINCEDKRKRYKLFKKLKSLEKSLSKNIVFGTKILLQRISYLSNNKKLNKEEILKIKEQYRDNRLLPINLIGEEHHKGNRKFNFDLSNNKIIYKPNKKLKISMEFHSSKNQQKILNKLQDILGTQAISIKLSKKYIWLSYDEEKLNGYSFNTKEFKIESNTKISKEDKKEIYMKYCNEQKERKLNNKIRDRYMGIDLNPEYIGWSISNSNTIIDKGCYDLSKLNTKLRLNSSDLKQVYQNDKRKHEIKQVLKDLFNKCEHYKVAYLAIEELNFKSNSVNIENKESNRKCKNLWHRSLTTNIINKYCNILGIQKIEVNPCYSSFIGNIKYNFFDPINSSLEICRRGIDKFKKGKFYPIVTKIDLDTMSNLIKMSDVLNKTELLRTLKFLTNWKDFYNLFRQTKLKYRCSLSNFKEFSLNNSKSLVTLYSY